MQWSKITKSRRAPRTLEQAYPPKKTSATASVSSVRTKPTLLDFLAEIDAIDAAIAQYVGQTAAVKKLHVAALTAAAVDGAADGRTPTKERIHATTAEALAHAGHITTAIRTLERDVLRAEQQQQQEAASGGGGGGDGGGGEEGDVNIMRAHVQRVKEAFRHAMMEWEKSENEAQRRYREQLMQHVRIVLPDADLDEVMAAAESGQTQVFSRAALFSRTSNTSSKSTTTLQAVMARQSEIQHIQDSMRELSTLFATLAAQVELDEPALIAVEADSEKVVENLEVVNKELSQATKHARKRRRHKWYLLGIVVVVFVVIAGIITLVFL